MVEISAELVRSLRERTGAGLMDCKTALKESAGDMDAARDWLRVKGRARAEKRAQRSAKEGVIALSLSDKGDEAALIELNSETDFVAGNEDFAALAKDIARHALMAPQGLEDFLKAEAPSSKASKETIEDKIKDATARMGENIILRRLGKLSAEEGVLASYLHQKREDSLGRIGVLVSLRAPQGHEESALSLGKEIAMHIAASAPQAVAVEDITPQAVEKERALLTEQASSEGKPEKILGKIVEGRLQKYYEEVALLQQEFIMTPGENVGAALKAASEECGGEVSVQDFIRFAVGEDAEGAPHHG